MGWSKHAHGGHAWVRMGAGGYNCGLEHGGEATQVADDHFQAWTRARKARTTKKEGLVRRGKDG